MKFAFGLMLFVMTIAQSSMASMNREYKGTVVTAAERIANCPKHLGGNLLSKNLIEPKRDGASVIANAVESSNGAEHHRR